MADNGIEGDGKKPPRLMPGVSSFMIIRMLLKGFIFETHLFLIILLTKRLLEISKEILLIVAREYFLALVGLIMTTIFIAAY